MGSGRVPWRSRTLYLSLVARSPKTTTLEEAQQYFRPGGRRPRARHLPDGQERYIKTWNAGAEAIKGYKAEEIVGQHFSRFYSREVAAGKRRASWRSRPGRPLPRGGWRVRKDGTLLGSVVLSAGGTRRHAHGYLKITRDLTDPSAPRTRCARARRSSPDGRGREGLRGLHVDPTGTSRAGTPGRGYQGIQGGEVIGSHFSRFYTQRTSTRQARARADRRGEGRRYQEKAGGSARTAPRSGPA